MSNYINDEGELIYVQIEPKDIDLFNKLIEGYDNMALVTTVDASLGQLVLRVAHNAKKDIMAVLHCLPIPVFHQSHLIRIIEFFDLLDEAIALLPIIPANIIFS